MISTKLMKNTGDLWKVFYGKELSIGDVTAIIRNITDYINILYEISENSNEDKWDYEPQRSSMGFPGRFT